MSFTLALIAAFIGVLVILGIMFRLKHQVGGGIGPSELSDGSVTLSPTGYPEEMKGAGKKISPIDNDAADYK